MQCYAKWICASYYNNYYTDLPFLSLGITAGVETQELPRLDDWASDAIPVPTGFPFATYNHTSFYVSYSLA